MLAFGILGAGAGSVHQAALDDLFAHRPGVSAQVQSTNSAWISAVGLAAPSAYRPPRFPAPRSLGRETLGLPRQRRHRRGARACWTACSPCRRLSRALWLFARRLARVFVSGGEGERGAQLAGGSERSTTKHLTVPLPAFLQKIHSSTPPLCVIYTGTVYCVALASLASTGSTHASERWSAAAPGRLHQPPRRPRQRDHHRHH